LWLLLLDLSLVNLDERMIKGVTLRNSKWHPSKGVFAGPTFCDYPF
jgi:hypothetical protein